MLPAARPTAASGRALRGAFHLAVLAALLISAPASAQIRISEVLANPVGPDAGNQKVELTNTATATINIGGWWICGFFAYRQFPASVPLAPGGKYVIHIGATGTNDSGNYYTGAFPTLSPTDDSFSLYWTNSFGSASAIADFVQWGATGQARENVAILAGVWPAGQYRPRAPEGGSVQLCVPAIGAADWHPGPPTLGSPNACEPPVPENSTTWSRLKASYR
mgnify:CR=1 FL=1